MLALGLIGRKRDGGRIDAGEWRALANAYAAGHIPDYQMAALLMACFLRGLDRAETNALTDAMLRSGETLDLSELGRPRIDKHSTAGVADKVSIVLAQMMTGIGADHDCPVVALLPAMDRPLGRAGGNALEVEEAILALRGEGPPDLMRVTYALGAEMLVLAGVTRDYDDAHRQMERQIATGRAAEHFQHIIEAQGVNPAVVDDAALLPQGAEVELFSAPRRGFVSRVAPRPIGRGIIALGGGRTTMEERHDLSVGLVLTAPP